MNRHNSLHFKSFHLLSSWSKQVCKSVMAAGASAAPFYHVQGSLSFLYLLILQPRCIPIKVFLVMMMMMMVMMMMKMIMKASIEMTLTGLGGPKCHWQDLANLIEDNDPQAWYPGVYYSWCSFVAVAGSEVIETCESVACVTLQFLCTCWRCATSFARWSIGGAWPSDP